VTRWLIALGALVLGTACGPEGSGGMPAQDPERQSVAEQDIATDLWLRRAQPRQALEHALEALRLNDENAEASHLAAQLFLFFCLGAPHECRPAEAERHARRALELKPDFREARNTLGVVLIHRKRYREAVAVLRPLSEDILYQTPEQAWGNLGWAYLHDGQLDLAVEALRRSVAAQPLFCVGHYRLGVALERKGSPAAAVEAFGRALTTEHPSCKGLQEAFAGRGRLLQKLGRADEAEADLGRCVELDRQSAAGRECASLLGQPR